MKVQVATLLACDFCGKDQNEVSRLVRGPKDICICGECVDLCVEILAGNTEPEQTKETS